jgi:hypothetical protein
MTIHGLSVRITTRKSGQLIRRLTIDPSRRYQPLKARTGLLKVPRAQRFTSS